VLTLMSHICTSSCATTLHTKRHMWNVNQVDRESRPWQG
jgi:hypothetical protein